MLPIISPWPYFIGMAWLLCVAYLLARAQPERSPKLHIPLESLRGILASSVFFCHAVVTYFYFTTGDWRSPPSVFYEYLGSFPVDLFFFISGYLFWSKGISENGFHQVKDFWVARLRRIVPAYYVSVLLVVTIALAETRFSLDVSLKHFLSEIISWLLFCIPNLGQPINGFRETPLINAAVIWTLELELVFYALVPLLYAFFKGYRIVAYLAIVAFVYWYIGHSSTYESASWADDAIPRLLARFFAFGFGTGMLAAFLLSKSPKPWLVRLRDRRWSVIPVLFLVSPGLLGLRAHSVGQFMLLTVPFVFIVAGNDLFGLLTMRSALMLGRSSYSFYITHGIVLFGLSHSLNHWVPVTSLSTTSYWFFMGACGTVAVCLAQFLYWSVEAPFMRKGSALGPKSGH
jgi:peptidoglycan/LPS O-acetylase OafA/YrhL